MIMAPMIMSKQSYPLKKESPLRKSIGQTRSLELSFADRKKTHEQTHGSVSGLEW